MRQNYRILVAEDDEGIQYIYRDVLGLRYDLTFCRSVVELEALMNEDPKLSGFDLALFDIKLDDGSSLDVLESMELLGRLDCDYIVVSSVSDVDILRYCFKNGARDYLTKPFSREELLVKVQMLLRRAPLKQWGKLERQNVVEELTPKERVILTTIIDQSGIMDKQELVKRVWPHQKVSSNTIDVHLSNLRRKVRAAGYDIKCRDRTHYYFEYCTSHA